ncbi:hypothetical protein GXY_00973 [Novacetimonas hansenii ATCC 23769]|uniref:Uncharacterized protein n=1 Tax=Novacetimonas hansenii ATCC 23769 TaxID=714995 RepID=D5QAS4_NOVHA|nr:hypothetical protein GXY_00973 [Novacetimonas hansenii ATCC 23769]
MLKKLFKMLKQWTLPVLWQVWCMRDKEGEYRHHPQMPSSITTF